MNIQSRPDTQRQCSISSLNNVRINQRYEKEVSFVISHEEISKTFMVDLLQATGFSNSVVKSKRHIQKNSR